MKLIGLTGGIGTGKSTAARLLSELGVPVVDTDVLARELVEPGQPALAEIAAAFGANLLHPDGSLRRDRLAEVIFASSEHRHRLEAILHPRIRERWLAEAAAWRAQGRPVGTVVIPLLFETDAQPAFDVTVCTACTAATQWERLRARNWSDQHVCQRLEAQWPLERKMAASRFVIWTEGVLDVHRRQWQRLLDRR